MTQNITPENILLYIYGEANPELMQQIAAAIQSDSALYQFYTEALEVKKALESQPLLNPNPTSEKIIMEESHDSYSETV